MRIFVAGASGAVGVPVLRKLLDEGHQVTGLSNSDRGASRIREAGATPVQADIFDLEALRTALRQANAEVVIDELTSLPPNPGDLSKAAANDARVRLEGGGNLFRAAVETGVRRYMQQSSGFFLVAPEGKLADESSELAIHASPGVRASAMTYVELERRVRSSSMEWVALRYGFFYGPGTWFWQDGAYAEMVRHQKFPVVDRGQAVWSFVHVEDAAAATAAAIHAESGVYIITDDNPSPLHVWLPAFARWVGAPPPQTVSRLVARMVAGEDAVYYATKLSGASNAKARGALGFQPRRLVWL
jgi:2-alkyl-3-oxoalkanoate reductase